MVVVESAHNKEWKMEKISSANASPFYHILSGFLFDEGIYSMRLRTQFESSAFARFV